MVNIRCLVICKQQYLLNAMEAERKLLIYFFRDYKQIITKTKSDVEVKINSNHQDDIRMAEARPKQ